MRTVINWRNVTEVRSGIRIDAVIEDFMTVKGKRKGSESGNYREDAMGINWSADDVLQLDANEREPGADQVYGYPESRLAPIESGEGEP